MPPIHDLHRERFDNDATDHRAVDLVPERTVLRANVGELLSHRPETWSEALAQHAATLEHDPVHTGALLATLRIACARDDAAGIKAGRALLTALGIANPSESSDARERFGFPLAPEAALDEPLGEALRKAVQRVAAEIGSALQAPAELSKPDADADRVTLFRAAALTELAELTAPGLLPLPTQDVSDVVRCVVALALSPDSVHASGATLNALAGTIGHRARRRVKRALAQTSVESLDDFDFEGWQRDLRALAAARAVDGLGGDLRAALVALVCEMDDRSPAEIDATADLCPLVAACPEARALVARAARAWTTRVRTWGRTAPAERP